MKLRTEHFERARDIVLRWRTDGYDNVVVLRNKRRATRCYPSRRQDLPAGAIPSCDYYQIPTAEALAETAPSERNASRAEPWVAATTAYGYEYTAAASAAR